MPATINIPVILCIAAVQLHGRCQCHRPTLLFVTLFQNRPTAQLTNARTVRGRKGPGPGYLERQFQGTKVPWNERSRERMFQGTNGPENEIPSWERMFQGTNSLGNEYSWYR